jgi:hypothetical protein
MSHRRKLGKQYFLDKPLRAGGFIAYVACLHRVHGLFEVGSLRSDIAEKVVGTSLALVAPFALFVGPLVVER